VTETDPGGRERLLQRLRGTSRWLVGGGIAAIAALVGLVFVLFPNAKPKATTECSALGGKLSNVQATGSFTRGAYLERAQPGSSAGLPAARREQRGELITFDFTTQGYVKKTLDVSTRVVTAGRAPVAGPELDIPIALTIVPQSCEDGGQREVWSALPSGPGRYRVEVRLLDPNGQALDADETAPVRGG
jgi:hypothetical protein